MNFLKFIFNLFSDFQRFFGHYAECSIRQAPCRHGNKLSPGGSYIPQNSCFILWGKLHAQCSVICYYLACPMVDWNSRPCLKGAVEGFQLPFNRYRDRRLTFYSYNFYLFHKRRNLPARYLSPANRPARERTLHPTSLTCRYLASTLSQQQRNGLTL